MRLDEGGNDNDSNMENGNSHQQNENGDALLITTASVDEVAVADSSSVVGNGDAVLISDKKCLGGPSSNADESESLASSSVIQEEEEEGDNDHDDHDRPTLPDLSSSSSASARRPVAVSVSVGGESIMAMTPTSPRSITTASMSASDDMVEHENETMRDRVSDLEKRVHDQNDEITCLRATLADALRRINTLESGKEHVQINHVMRDPRLRHPDGHGPRTPGLRRPISGAYSNAHDPVGSRRSIANIYQSTGSLHSDGHSSNSMSPAPSPSPTHAGLHHPHHHHPHGRASTAPVRSSGLASRDGQLMPPPPPSSPAAGGSNNNTPLKQRNLSGSMSNLSLSGSRKWNSTSDFRDQSPAPNGSMARRFQVGSMQSLRSPFGSQQNLSDRGLRHGTKDAVYNDEDGTVRFFVRGRPVQLYAPTDLVDTYSLAQVSPAPPVKPRLEWVYGYRGRDARSNLFLLPTGEMVYFVAAVVVMFNAEEHSQRHYLGHTEDIKCLVVHPNKLLIATGQTAGHDRREGRAHVRVWNSVSLQTLHVIGIGDFERSVVCVSFSKADGGNLLVTVDEGSDHTMSVWDWSRGDRGTKVTETKCSTETVVTAEFHPLEAGLIVCIGKGHVNFWQLDSTALTLSRKTGLFDQRDKPKYVTCLAFSFTGDVLTGDSNGNVFVWGRGYNAVTKALRKVHDGPIFSLCVLKDGSIVTGGGKDRRLVQFDTVYKRTGLEAELPEHLGSVRTISQGRGSQLLLGSTRNFVLQGTFELGFQEIVTGHVDEVWALAAHPQQNQFLSAGYDMHIHLWDALAHRAVWSSSLGGQAHSACFSSTGEVIVVGMTSGKWMVLDSQTREVYGVHQDGVDAIQTVRFSPDDKLLALGSRDGVIYMYQAAEGCKKFSRMGRCVGDVAKRRSSAGASTSNPVLLGHSCQITHLDWSADSTYLQSNSGDYELIYWNASICRPVTNQTTMRDVDWSTQTCILSFGTIGVWPETVDGTEIYTCARTRNKRLLATGDDFGKIKLFASPATQPKSLFHTVGGHSSHVTHLEFLQDDTRMISSGGRDTALMQWVLS